MGYVNLYLSRELGGRMKGVHAASNVSTESPADLVDALFRSTAVLRLSFAEFLGRYELTEGRYSVLAALDQAGSSGLSQASLADNLMHSESNVSSLIDRLQGDGLVDRQLSSSDRRKRVLRLTPAGQSLIDQIEAARRMWAEEQLTRLELAERANLIRLLSQLASPDSPPSRNNVVTVSVPVQTRLENWTDPHHVESPQSALERMLSTLGVTDRFAGEDR